MRTSVCLGRRWGKREENEKDREMLGEGGQAASGKQSAAAAAEAGSDSRLHTLTLAVLLCADQQLSHWHHRRSSITTTAATATVA